MTSPAGFYRRVRRWRGLLCAVAMLLAAAGTSAAQTPVERMYFPAVDNVTNVLVSRINAETVRIDMSAWYLTEGAIVNALLNKHSQGVPIRLIGDRGSIFEIDQFTRDAFYRLADAGVPIRLRYFPTWYPEIAHWKATIFVGQGVITFGSANYTPFELAPVSSTNYKDETVLFTDDVVLVNAFKTKFDQMWNDTTREPLSRISGPPYFLNWHDACKRESACSDFKTRYPNPQPMIIDTARLEPDNPLPPEMVWGQGSVFNNRLVQEINKESTFIDFVIYRLTVDNITTALLNKHNAGVPVRLIIEPNEYRNKKWPEFWITHANMDKLWAAGVPMKWRLHQGLTHMKMLVTSAVATNASSNLAAAWQRDHNYFVPAVTKPGIYNAMRDRFVTMWGDTAGFTDFTPEAPDTPTLSTPPSGATGVATNTSLVWNRAPFATAYDVYLGTSSGAMTKVGTVPALLVNDPPLTYYWTPPTALQPGTTYYWKVEALTNATHLRPDLIRPSVTRSFTTAGTPPPPSPPAEPTSPSPATGATAVSLSPQLSWSAGAPGTTFSVAFGTSSNPPTVATGLTSPSYSPGPLAATTTYYWRVTATSSGGSTPGALWSFTTSAPPPSAEEIVIYASDVTSRFGAWQSVADGSAAGGVLLRHPDTGFANTTNALSTPTHYFEATFNAQSGTLYRVWLRLRAKDDAKSNDSVFVQFSGAVTSGGQPLYRIGTTSALTENLWTCGSCQSAGWGWSRHAYWLGDTGEVRFQTTGPQTLRIQTREDGVDIDQIVISPATYLTQAPGPATNDATIVPKSTTPPPQAPGTPGSEAPANGSTTASVTPTLSWSASGATSYDVHFGTAATPPLVSSAQTSASYTPGALNAATTYYWQIVARNDAGTTSGPVWSFTTPSGTPPPPQPPGTPGSESPANGSTTASVTPTLSWSASGATSYDVYFGTAATPPLVSSAQTSASYAPGTLSYQTTYYWQIAARNADGTTTGPVWSFTTPDDPGPPPPAPTDIVIYASDVPDSALNGAWSKSSDGSSPNGVSLVTTNTGFAATNTALAAPAHYVDVTFTAVADTPYRLWLRLRALGEDKYNDSVWVQFTDARANGQPVYGIGSTAGLLVNLATSGTGSSLNNWGWQNGAYWLTQSTVFTFPTTGTRTLRIQVREDGVMLDQIVLSPGNYMNQAPGPVTNDGTIVPKP